MFVNVMPFLFLIDYSDPMGKTKDTQQDPFIRFYLKDTHEKLLTDKLQSIN